MAEDTPTAQGQSQAREGRERKVGAPWWGSEGPRPSKQALGGALETSVSLESVQPLALHGHSQ